MKKFLVSLLFLLGNSCVNAAAIQSIHFGTEATYPPFESIDESGKMTGFDIDIANALCEKIHATCHFSNQSFNSLIPSVQVGKFDAIIGALGMTSEREKQVSFTNPYYEPSASFVAPLAKHYTINDLNGKTIGAQQGSTFETYLHDRYAKQVNIKSYASVQDAFLDLVSGRVDIVIVDTPIAQTWLKQNDQAKTYGIVGKPIVDHTYFGTGYGIAVAKKNTDLLIALNNALAAIKADGTYEKITQKYFSIK